VVTGWAFLKEALELHKLTFFLFRRTLGVPLIDEKHDSIGTKSTF